MQLLISTRRGRQIPNVDSVAFKYIFEVRIIIAAHNAQKA